MTSKIFLCLLRLLVFVVPGCLAQGADSNVFKVGDVFKYKLSQNGQQDQNIYEELIAVDGDNILSLITSEAWNWIGVSKLRTGGIIQSLCFNPQLAVCKYSEELKLIEVPIEIGQKRKVEYGAISGPTVTHIKEQSEVVGKEKILISGSPLDAYRLSFSGEAKGNHWRFGKYSRLIFRFKGDRWVSLVNGNPVLVKEQFRIDFGNSFSRELIELKIK